MKYSEKLYLRYKEEIESWDWDSIKKDAMTNCYFDRCECDYIMASTWLGTVFALMPSGKYYMPWTTNQTVKDVIKDQAYWQALEEIAEKYGMYIASGPGDPCDLHAEFSIDLDEYKELKDKIQFVEESNREEFESYYELE